MSAYRYTQRTTSSNAGTLQAEQVDLYPGQHYDPWQRATLTNGRTVWITRQNGDGQKSWFYTDQNEVIAPEQIQEWI